MITIECSTLFDITATGITGHFRSSRLPFQDRAGHRITNEESWNRARNQQRNWETLTQIIGIRTQLFELTEPQEFDGIWRFTFATETPSVFGTPDDPTAVLRADAEGVPMLRELDNDPDIDSVLITDGARQNIWFNLILVNN